MTNAIQQPRAARHNILRMGSVRAPSASSSADGAFIDDLLRPIVEHQGGAKVVLPSANAAPTEATLFESSLGIKVLIANVAMHLEDDWRHSFFKQLDNLLDAEAWESDEPLPSQESVLTFLRTMIFHRFTKRPSLGFFSGNILATWIDDAARITIEFGPADQTRWVLALHSDPVETASGICDLRVLPTRVQAWGISDWLFAHDQPR